MFEKTSFIILIIRTCIWDGSAAVNEVFFAPAFATAEEKLEMDITIFHVEDISKSKEFFHFKWKWKKNPLSVILQYVRWKYCLWDCFLFFKTLSCWFKSVNINIDQDFEWNFSRLYLSCFVTLFVLFFKLWKWLLSLFLISRYLLSFLCVLTCLKRRHVMTLKLFRKQFLIGVLLHLPGLRHLDLTAVRIPLRLRWNELIC